MQDLRSACGEESYIQRRKQIRLSLTEPCKQFKKRRIDQKVQKVIATFDQVREHNVYERRQGQTLTPLLMGKIQFGKLKKAHNLNAIRKECLARGLQFDNSTNWKSLISMIKNHEKDNKYFKPLTNYNSFKWNASHFNKNGEVI